MTGCESLPGYRDARFRIYRSVLDYETNGYVEDLSDRGRAVARLTSSGRTSPLVS